MIKRKKNVRTIRIDHKAEQGCSIEDLYGIALMVFLYISKNN